MSPRPIPDEGLIRRALAVRLATETPMEEHFREEFDAMIGGTRIAMDAARKLWPVEIDHMSTDVEHVLRNALRHLEKTYALLDSCAERIGGVLLHRAILGEDIRDALEQAENAAKVGPRHEASAAPPVEPAS